LDPRQLLFVCFIVLPLALGGCSNRKAPNPSTHDGVCDWTNPADSGLPLQRNKLQARLDEVLHRRDDAEGNIKCAARVIELDTGRELYSNLADEPFLPASNGKLAVSAAALDAFGSGRTFDTHLAISGDDLWLIGTGDPAVGDPAIEKKRGRLPTSVLEDWATALLKRGVTEIKGNLYFYDAAFDETRFNPYWSKEQRIPRRLVRRAGVRAELQRRLHRRHRLPDRRRPARRLHDHAAGKGREDHQQMPDRHRRGPAGHITRCRVEHVHDHRRHDETHDVAQPIRR
jgi:hypothetical protein